MGNSGDFNRPDNLDGGVLLPNAQEREAAERKKWDRDLHDFGEAQTTATVRLAMFTRWLAFATFVLALAAIWQGWTAKEAANAAKDAADTASKTLKEMQTGQAAKDQHAQLVGTFGAIIPEEIPRPQSLPTALDLFRLQGIYQYFDNVGKVPARDVAAQVELRRESLPNYRLIGTPQSKVAAFKFVRPFGPEADVPGMPHDEPYIAFDVNGFTQSELDRIARTQEVLEVHVQLQYNDGFDDIEKKSYCSLYDAEPPHQLSNGANTGPGGSWGDCDAKKRYIALESAWTTHSTR